MEADSTASSVGPVDTEEFSSPIWTRFLAFARVLLYPCCFPEAQALLLCHSSGWCVRLGRRTRSLWDQLVIEVCVWFQGSRHCEWEFPAAVRASVADFE